MIGILTITSLNLLREVITKKLIVYWFESGLYSLVVEKTFKFLILYKEPSLNMCLNLVTKFFLIVACIRFSYEKEKHATLSVKQLRKKLEKIMGEWIFYTIFSSIKIMFTLINSLFFFVLIYPHILKSLTFIIQLSLSLFNSWRKEYSMKHIILKIQISQKIKTQEHF